MVNLMKIKNSIFLMFPAPRLASALFAAFIAFALLSNSNAAAQAPPVPAEYQDLYSSLSTYLSGFNTTLNASPLSQYPTLSTGNLKNANANAGPQLVNPGSMPGILLQIQELKAIGVQAVMIEIGFPMLYEPFLTSQGQSYSQFVTFYQQVAAAVRAAGMKLIVENDTLLVNDVQAGWDAAPFYATLSWSQYEQARAQTAATVAQTLQPDYLVLLEEPTTEANDSGQTQANTPSGSLDLLSQILASAQQAGVPGMKMGAGTGTAQVNFLQFIQGYVTLPLNFIDMHIYPVNRTFLPNALQIASTAAAAGLPVSMSECWLWKVRDSELNILTPSEVRARNPFSFWEPLDSSFIQTMQSLAAHSQMMFMDPFNSELYAAYLTYNSGMDSLTPSQMTSEESAQASQNMGQALYTPTAMSYYASLAVPPDQTPPTVPSGVTGASANPNTVTLNWTASTDNLGVAGYYVLRNGVNIGSTASLYYQDSGLTESTTYTYTIEAFDLGGNVSAPSLRTNVTTDDVTPPSIPTNLSAIANSCQRVTLTWSPSTDLSGIGSYIVLWGLSPNSLAQIARTAGTTTTYTNTPLTAGTTYYYAVEAADNSGNVSAMSLVVGVLTPMPPSAPATIAATAAATTRISVTWSTATGGGLPVQYYHVFRGSSASSLTQVAIVSSTSYTDTTVTQGTTYFYGVESADTGCDLSVMSPVISTTTPMPPSAPANLAATPYSTTKVGFTWSVAASGGLPIQNYRIWRGTTSANLVQLAIVLQTSYTDTTVTAGAVYYYAVQAADSGADLSPLSPTILVTVPSGPSMPTGLLATPVSTTKVSLIWSVPAGGGLAVSSYHVLRGTTASNMAQVAVVGQPSYTDACGSPSTTYYYAVQALDTGGDLSPVSATVSATTLALPSAPVNVAATAPYRNQVTITWTAVQSGMPLSSFTIFRGPSANNLTSLRVVTATQSSATDGTVSPGTTYYYALQAKDTGNNVSPMSAVVPVTTPN